jgi:hypothetical protein
MDLFVTNFTNSCVASFLGKPRQTNDDKFTFNVVLPYTTGNYRGKRVELNTCQVVVLGADLGKGRFPQI